MSRREADQFIDAKAARLGWEIEELLQTTAEHIVALLRMANRAATAGTERDQIKRLADELLDVAKSHTREWDEIDDAQRLMEEAGYG